MNLYRNIQTKKRFFYILFVRISLLASIDLVRFDLIWSGLVWFEGEWREIHVKLLLVSTFNEVYVCNVNNR